jgi:hypothetical protein
MRKFPTRIFPPKACWQGMYVFQSAILKIPLELCYKATPQRLASAENWTADSKAHNPTSVPEISGLTLVAATGGDGGERYYSSALVTLLGSRMVRTRRDLKNNGYPPSQK